MGPEPIGDRRPRKVDNCIHRFWPKILKPCDSPYLSAADFGDFSGRATPNREVMSLTQPVSAELTSYQTSTAGQQYVHDIFLAWRFTRITSLFL
ncbi:hypothetical protein EMIT0194MI4_110179 [Pseudomonas sp. IT-194MI4]